MKRKSWLTVVAACWVLLCCDDGGGGDADADIDADIDADSDADSGSDSGADGDIDSDSDTDGTGPLDGFGTLSGDCGFLDEGEWGSTEPFLFRNVLDFGTAAFDPTLLSDGAQEILEEGTAGGSSGESEAVSYDILYRCELADLLLSETEVVYNDPDSQRIDYLASIDARNVGVSVTRAYHYPPAEPCVVADLVDLIDRKLVDILDAESHADPSNPWTRSILHVIAYSAQCADAAVSAYETIDSAVQADTIVVITVTEGADEFIY
jgi:hypothetical protein